VTWFGVLVLVRIAVVALLNVLTVGKPRKPLTPGDVAATLVLQGLIVWGILAVGTGSLSQ
jgi:putative copper export protein